jgi:hypothetical protein
MPEFLCSIKNCKNHSGYDCNFKYVSVKPRSNDWDMTIACSHYAEKPGMCEFCNKETSPNTDICVDCMVE